MELLFNVEGMMCGGCENRVKTALSEIDGVKEVIANHENGTVVVSLINEIDREILIEAIENLGFEVKED